MTGSIIAPILCRTLTNNADNTLSLVTGATGLLGSHIVEQLVKRGRRVRALVRPSANVSFLQSQGIELVEGDLTDPASLNKACQGVDLVYHAAAQVGDWGPWSQFVEITINGTKRLIDAAAAAKVKRFLHISSISVYGHVDGKGLVFDEAAELGQKLYRWSYYSRSKVEAEKLVWQAHREGRIVATVLRPSWLYGARDRVTMGRLIDSIRQGKTKLIGPGDNRLNVVNAANVAEAAIMAAESPQAAGEAYNCSNDGVMTQAQYFNMVAEALGCPPIKRSVPYKVAKTAAFLMEAFGHLTGRKKPPLVTRYAVWLIGRQCYFECEKARRQLGWKSTIPYDQGVPAAVRDHLTARGEMV